jgi:hypothetical protein
MSSVFAAYAIAAGIHVVYVITLRLRRKKLREETDLLNQLTKRGNA